MRYLCIALLAFVASCVMAEEPEVISPGVICVGEAYKLPMGSRTVDIPTITGTMTLEAPKTVLFKGDLVLKDGEGVLTYMKPCAPIVVAGPAKAPSAATPESVEVKDNKDGTATVTVTVAVKAVQGDTASVARQRALVTAAAACNDAAHAERLTDAEIEDQRAKEIAEANAKADRLKASRPKEK